ncbi:MAG: hypothetical protein V4858_17255 [Pseudomonadota bacterium]
MPTPTLITDLDPVAANNFPAGSDAPSTLDDTLRAHGAFIRQQLDATQTQLYTAFTTGGSTTAYTLTPAPALTALAAGQRFRVKINATNTSTTPTLAISGLTAKALKVYNSAGAKADPAVGALVANMLTDVEYDGTDMVVLDQLPTAGASAASETAAGVSELATAAEFITGTDAARIPTVKVARDNAIVLSAATTLTGLGSNWDSGTIPPWAKEIVITVVAGSSNGTNGFVVQLGDAGGLETSGYSGASLTITAAGNGATQYNTSGFGIRSGAAADVIHGSIVLRLHDAATFTWVATGMFHKSNAAEGITTNGSKSLSAALDRVRFTTNSAEVFDGGTISYSYR